MQTYPDQISDMDPKLLRNLVERLREHPSFVTAREKRMLADFVEQKQLGSAPRQEDTRCEA